MNIKIGDNAPEEVNAFIEIPQGSSIKYELDKEMGVLMVDRFVHGPMYFPFNYGFIPETMGEDGDPLDILVLTSVPVHPGVVIKSRVIGMLSMDDEAGADAKIIAIPTAKVDPLYQDINDIESLPKITKERVKNFFDHYKDLETGKWVKTKDFLDKQAAFDEIIKAKKT